MDLQAVDIFILVLVAAMLAGAVRLYRGRKRRGGCCGGSSGCTGNCSSCAGCHSRDPGKKK